ncbi:hypothetical protein [Burkholderia diffusa]|uniref:hypothetical protein n=1 Tax=Burkholderia diffusa TaxID=488732 RepID=UPI001ABAD92E|nr:hypothetical protein [Burkholderia diffusa]
MTFVAIPAHRKSVYERGYGRTQRCHICVARIGGFQWRERHHVGDVSFFSSYQDTAIPSLLDHKLGEDFYITRGVFKPWPTGQPIAAPLDALHALLKQHPTDFRQIREIVVSYWSRGTITDNSGPRTSTSNTQ